MCLYACVNKSRPESGACGARAPPHLHVLKVQ